MQATANRQRQQELQQAPMKRRHAPEVRMPLLDAERQLPVVTPAAHLHDVRLPSRLLQQRHRERLVVQFIVKERRQLRRMLL